ncbi:hypothetical protein BDZ45DRAFT_751607 [Acephala macrosclerotiorum]|nr:hypothetical protein BDZ45DRAFT_751607 [Acephala macrosclerotiorum]
MTTIVAASSTSIPYSTTITGAGISLFNRGPVTSLFTPPASCLSTLTYGGGALYFGHNGDAYYDPACYPSPSSNLASQSSSWNLYFYSPAQCPSGWNSQLVTNTYSTSTTVLSFDSDNTVVLCCPPGYTSLTSYSHSCASNVFGISVTTLYYKSPSSIGPGFWTSTSPSSPFPTILGGPSGGVVPIYGDGILAVWKSSDAVVFTAGSSPTTSSTSQTPSTTAPGNGTSGTPPGASHTSSGLSTGAKIGIGIGIPALVLILAALGFFIYRRRVKKQPVRTDAGEMSIPVYRPELSGQPKDGTFIPQQYPQGPTYHSTSPINSQPHQLGLGIPADGQRYSDVPTYQAYSPVRQEHHELPQQ